MTDAGREAELDEGDDDAYRIGPYEVTRKIGSGGMAEVFEAVDHSGAGGFEKLVCVKRILPHLITDERFIELFLEEGRLSAKLHHDNIVEVYACNQDRDGNLYLAMELVPGCDLRALLKAQPGKRLDAGSPRETARLISLVGLGVARALSHAHEPDEYRDRRAVVHCDVSTDNVLLRQDGAVKLTDYGIGKVMHSSKATELEGYRGKLAYSAPEQLEQRVLPATDLWALGVVLWELLVGWRPFEDPTRSADPVTQPVLTSRVSRNERRSIHDVAPDADPTLRELIEALLAPVEQRLQSAREVASKLSAIVGSPEDVELRLRALVLKQAPLGKRTTPVRRAAVRPEPVSQEGAPLAESSKRPISRSQPTAADAPHSPAAANAADAPAPSAVPIAAADVELAPGTIVSERFRVERKLGQGGMGAVYEVLHVTIKRRFALKVVHARFAAAPEVVQRFEREAQAATAIGHKHIVEVTDFGRLPDGRPFMVLEFLAGRDWEKDLKAQGPQPIGKTARVAIQVCKALGAAHDKGIVHRDIKPENIFLIHKEEDPDFVKVVDFGISKVQGDSDLGLTGTGAQIGTPYYMPPEQCHGDKNLDHRADLYALGVVLFRALSGVFPFHADTYPHLMLQIISEAPRSVLEWRADVPPELAQLVDRLLAKHPDGRPQSAAEVAQALLPYVNDTRAPVLRAPAAAGFAKTAPLGMPGVTAALPSSPEAQVTTPDPSRRTRRLEIAVAAAVAVLAALLGAAVLVLPPHFATRTSNPQPALSERPPLPVEGTPASTSGRAAPAEPAVREAPSPAAG
ncbi:MAG: protein kinase, partial [Sandaracinaceae bacterium]|nr:protein kinase [Sandaracinaceae bacterium]